MRQKPTVLAREIVASSRLFRNLAFSFSSYHKFSSFFEITNSCR